MSKVLETRIRVGVEARGGEQVAATIGNMATGAKGAQQAFEAAESARESLYAGLADDSPTAQRLRAIKENMVENKGEFVPLMDNRILYTCCTGH